MKFTLYTFSGTKRILVPKYINCTGWKSILWELKHIFLLAFLPLTLDLCEVDSIFPAISRSPQEELDMSYLVSMRLLWFLSSLSIPTSSSCVSLYPPKATKQDIAGLLESISPAGVGVLLWCDVSGVLFFPFAVTLCWIGTKSLLFVPQQNSWENRFLVSHLECYHSP